MSSGLVIGRFCPPHLGHSHLISRAAEQVDDLTVIVFSKDEEPVPGPLREQWLQELHPGVRVVNVHTDLATNWNDENTWQRWLALIRGVVSTDPNVVFSSEAYGGELAHRLGAANVVVDRAPRRPARRPAAEHPRGRWGPGPILLRKEQLQLGLQVGRS